MQHEDFELTLEQQFQMRQFEESAKNMTLEQARETLLQASKLVMIKDNVIRSLLKTVRYVDSGGIDGRD